MPKSRVLKVTVAKAIKAVLVSVLLLTSNLSVAGNAIEVLQGRYSKQGYYPDKEGALVLGVADYKHASLHIPYQVCGMAINIIPIPKLKNTFSVKVIEQDKGTTCPPTENMLIKVLTINPDTQVADVIVISGSDENSNGFYRLNPSW